MFRRAGIIECVDDRLCKSLVRRRVTKGLSSGGNRRRDGRSRPRYL